MCHWREHLFISEYHAQEDSMSYCEIITFLSKFYTLLFSFWFNLNETRTHTHTKIYSTRTKHHLKKDGDYSQLFIDWTNQFNIINWEPFREKYNRNILLLILSTDWTMENSWALPMQTCKKIYVENGCFEEIEIKPRQGTIARRRKEKYPHTNMFIFFCADFWWTNADIVTMTNYGGHYIQSGALKAPYLMSQDVTWCRKKEKT